MTAAQLEARKAVEALRSGVPSRAAVQVLGTTQTEILEKFDAALKQMLGGERADPIVISGSFGTGKSHLLNCLQARAQEERCVTSYLVVSPEAPLGNPHVVLKQIAESAKAPGRTGKALRELMSSFSVNSPSYADVRRWSRGAPINDRFRALLHLYEAFHADPQFQVQILNDYEGKALSKTEVRKRLKDIGESVGYDLTSPRKPLLAHDRIRVIAQLFRAACGSGWVILFDELERLDKFSQKQRAAAYAELGWWARLAREGAGVLPVFAANQELLRTRVLDDEQALTYAAPTALFEDREDLIGEGIALLKPPPKGVDMPLIDPTSEETSETERRVRRLYEDAYETQVSEQRMSSGQARRHIRSWIREWITIWDLERLHPGYKPSVDMEEHQSGEVSFGDDVIESEEDGE